MIRRTSAGPAIAPTIIPESTAPLLEEFVLPSEAVGGSYRCLSPDVGREISEAPRGAGAAVAPSTLSSIGDESGDSGERAGIEVFIDIGEGVALVDVGVGTGAALSPMGRTSRDGDCRACK
jgi:hypothetical protein